jgi:hypothetical protein
MNFEALNGKSEICYVVLALPHRELGVLPLDQLVKAAYGIDRCLF